MKTSITELKGKDMKKKANKKQEQISKDKHTQNKQSVMTNNFNSERALQAPFIIF